MSIQFKSTYLDVETYNVIGLLPGADKKLKEEYIVHSAHLDHVGVMAAVDGDSIYNGAHDNASGVSSSLGIAELYRTAKIRPRRSVLFLMVSAEELGLTGAGYFAAHPHCSGRIDCSQYQYRYAYTHSSSPVYCAARLSILFHPETY